MAESYKYRCKWCKKPYVKLDKAERHAIRCGMKFYIVKIKAPKQERE